MIDVVLTFTAHAFDISLTILSLVPCIQYTYNLPFFCLRLCREERSKFIRSKYADRMFIRDEDDVDGELQLACLKQTGSDDEKLLEENEEVGITRRSSRVTVCTSLISMFENPRVQFIPMKKTNKCNIFIPGNAISRIGKICARMIYRR